MNEFRGIYPAKAGDASELERAIGLCLIGSRVPDGLTWNQGSYAAWFGKFFKAVMAPHLQRVWAAEKDWDIHTILEADAALPPCSGSANAGRELVSALDGAKHLPVIRKFRNAVLEKKTPGHFATAFALQASSFHVPILTLVTGYAYLEWRTGKSATTKMPTIMNFLGCEFVHLGALLSQIYESHGSATPCRLFAIEH